MAKGNSATSRGRRIVLIATCLAALAAGGAGYWYWGQGSAGAQAARTAARAGVPVSIAIVDRQDVPIYLSGLGTVRASFTVGIHSQVDGKLQEVLFTEGQQVKKGDVLAKMDPRLFQAALDQAKAKKAQDIAQFTSASKDLERSNTLVKSNISSQQIVDLRQGKAEDHEAQSWVAVWREELRKLGWTEGRNIEIDIRWAAADVASMKRFAKELVALQPDLILTQSTPAAGAMLEQTHTIPVVFVL